MPLAPQCTKRAETRVLFLPAFLPWAESDVRKFSSQEDNITRSEKKKVQKRYDRQAPNSIHVCAPVILTGTTLPMSEPSVQGNRVDFISDEWPFAISRSIFSTKTDVV